MILLTAAAILILSNRGDGRRNVMVYGLGCALLMISTMVQYGPPFNGPAGIAIPIGLPLLIVIGYLLWKDADNAAVDEGDDNLSDEDDAAPLPAPAGANSSADD